MRRLPVLGLAWILWIFLAGCQKDSQSGAHQAGHVTAYTVAVVLPLSDEANMELWTRTLEWFEENLERAQRGLSDRISLNVEWHEEASDDPENHMITLGQELSARQDVSLVIGPQTSADAVPMARQLARSGKLMIAPSATSAELLRRYASKDFFWALCEPDITQCEVLLNKAQGYGASQVSLLADPTSYGQTFIDWFAFQATEMGLRVGGLYTWNEARKALTDGSDCLVTVPDTREDILDVLRLHRSLPDQDRPRLLFSDMALDATLLDYAQDVEGMEGVAPYADPATGFEVSYRNRYGNAPVLDQVKLYDALMLSALTLYEYDARLRKGEEGDLNSVLSFLMATRDAQGTALPRILAWDAPGMRMAMEHPGQFNLSGASGSLDFDTSLQSAILESVYCHWIVYQNQYIPVDYFSSSGSHRTSSLAASWQWRSTVTQELSDVDSGIAYEPQASSWAVLVCGSRGWSNYRHESDVLDMYRLLRQNGFDDDHIILAASPMEVANDVRNTVPGSIIRKPGGENLLEGVCLDYDTDTLSSRDVCRILLGERSAHLPVVLDTDRHSNILIYWSGHGAFGRFYWGLSEDDFTSAMLRETVRVMRQEGRFRKMLLATEPCCSGSVLSAIEGVPGVLGIASADDYEPSYGDVFDTSMSVWLSDRFTNTLIGAVEENPNQSFRNLYLRLVHQTYGSHVTILNYSKFDNLYRATPREFFVSLP